MKNTQNDSNRGTPTPITTPNRVEKPWGFELIFARTERYVGKILCIHQGHSLSRQYHEVKDETIFVSSGSLVLELGQGPTLTRETVGAGKSFRIKAGTIHRFIAEEPVELMEVSTPELDDVIRLEDNYGREGTNAP